eukprot:TRINITY_DN1052_c0_g1_i2.p1 TRINITY_DN1052_c0_g1~~TRINITY_DN1052_c0_g1_i2.p1  ORF type:complete len:224 (+),score=83.17 TRINITY_DN1052_c0_g1_i2:13-684(+)
MDNTDRLGLDSDTLRRSTAIVGALVIIALSIYFFKRRRGIITRGAVDGASTENISGETDRTLLRNLRLQRFDKEPSNPSPSSTSPILTPTPILTPSSSSSSSSPPSLPRKPSDLPNSQEIKEKQKEEQNKESEKVGSPRIIESSQDELKKSTEVQKKTSTPTPTPTPTAKVGGAPEDYESTLICSILRVSLLPTPTGTGSSSGSRYYLKELVKDLQTEGKPVF